MINWFVIAVIVVDDNNAATDEPVAAIMPTNIIMYIGSFLDIEISLQRNPFQAYLWLTHLKDSLEGGLT